MHDREVKECIVKIRYGMEIGYGQEIVRCKDCKHKVDTVDDYNYESECPCFCSGDKYYSWVPDDDWFCPRGEKKS